MKRLLYLSLLAGVSYASILCGNTENPTTAFKNAQVSNASSADVQSTGAIAYIRNGSEIRLIDSNGNNDRQLWTHPDAKEPLGLFDLAWRPDGRELAFSSAHEAVHSIYHADLYTIRPDGTGFRKITNAPDYKGLANYKKGTVSVTVRNNHYSFEPGQANTGVFILNVVGAEEPQQITLPPGASKTFVFKNVADFGDAAQPIVVMNGQYRWYMPGTDVVAGQTIKAPDMIVSGDGYPYFGAFRPVWKQDGSLLSYRDGLCEVKTTPLERPAGVHYYQPLFGKDHPLGSCVWDWGPTPALTDQILYTENESEEGSGIYLMKEGSKHNPASKLTLFSEIRYQIAHDLKWLPDGSGFLYSATNFMGDAANIFHYDMRTKQTKQVTNLQGAYTRRFSVSPSGQWIVYERCKTPEDYTTVDLWLIRTDGSGEKLLVKNGLGPSWSR